MLISREQVKKTAALAKLALGEEELDKLANQLQEFLDYIDVLREIPAGEVEPAGEDRESWLSEREDASCLRQEQVVTLAPDSIQGMIRVPKVIAHGEN